MRASSIAVGAPAQRAPTTIASYGWFIIDLLVVVDGVNDAPTARRRGSVRSPIPRLVSCRGRVGRGLGPAAQGELGEDVADVVLDRLAADVQPFGDLRVGQAVAEEGEHLGLPFVRTSATASVAVVARTPSERSTAVAASTCRAAPEPLERLQCGPGLGQRHLGTFGEQGVGELEARVRQLHRQLGPGEPGEGRAEARLRVSRAPGEADPPLGQGRGRRQVVARMSRRAQRQLLGGGLGLRRV